MTDFSTINMLGAWGWLALAAVPPAIIALYFLKLKRTPLEVPSTYLWRKSIEDLHVNSIWQRLRQNLLLFLQLLLVTLVILAMLRPGWRGATRLGERSIFLIDNSASMSAADVRPSRLAQAKQKTLELIDQMQTGDQAMVISFADNARVVHEFTDNRRALRRRVEQIEPTQRSTSLLGALKLADGLANPGRSASEQQDVAVADALPADLYIFSDGKFPSVESFSLGNLTPIYVPIGEPTAANVGITAFTTGRHESKPGELQAFGQIANHGPADVTIGLNLYLDDALVDADQLPIKAGDTRSVAFDLADVDSGVLRLEVQPGGALAVDDVAYAAVNLPRRGRVLLVTPGNEPLELALATDRARQFAEVFTADPAHLDSEEYREEAAAGAYDLVIFDQCRPASAERMPQANTLFIGRLPPLPAWEKAGAETTEKLTTPQIIDVDRAHPLLQLVDLGDVDVAESLALAPPPGSAVLVDSNRGPLMVIAPRVGYEDAVLGFEIIGTGDDGDKNGDQKYVNTNWPLRLSFPTFVFNSLEYLGGHRRAHAAGAIRPGETVNIRSETPAEKLLVRSPDGRTHEILRGQQNAFAFTATDQIGVYEVREGKQLTQRLAVNLADSMESDVAPRAGADQPIQIGYVEVAGRQAWQASRSEGWRYLLLAALVVLLLEWYIYNRRVYL